MAMVTSLAELHRRMESGSGYAVGTFPAQISRCARDVIYSGCPECETAVDGLFCNGDCKAIITATIPYFRLRVLIKDSSASHWAIAWKENAVTLMGKSPAEFQELCAAKKEKSVVDLMKRTLWVLKVEIAKDKNQRGYLRIGRVEKKQALIPPATNSDEGSSLMSDNVDEDLNDFTPISRRLFGKNRTSLTGNAIENPLYSNCKSVSSTVSDHSQKPEEREKFTQKKAKVYAESPEAGSHITVEADVSEKAEDFSIHSSRMHRPDEGQSKFLIGCAAGLGSGILLLLIREPTFCAGFFTGVSSTLVFIAYIIACRLKEMTS